MQAMRETIRYATGDSGLGTILVAASDKGVCAIFLGDPMDELLADLQRRFPKAELIGGDDELEQWLTRIRAFLDAPNAGLQLPLDVRGTEFQQRVWKALGEIGVGKTASYTEVAERIGSPKAVRAVAGACAANPLSLVIPCHRVVRTDGSLSGYYWGVERKRELLKREAAKG